MLLPKRTTLLRLRSAQWRLSGWDPSAQTAKKYCAWLEIYRERVQRQVGG